MSWCAKGADWQLALGLLSTMTRAKVEANTMRYNAALSACEKGHEWQLAVGLLSRMAQANVEASIITWNGDLVESPSKLAILWPQCRALAGGRFSCRTLLGQRLNPHERILGDDCCADRAIGLCG